MNIDRLKHSLAVARKNGRTSKKERIITRWY